MKLPIAGMLRDVVESLFTRFRIEQTVRWWRYAALLVLVQWLVLIVLGKGLVS